MQCLPRPSIATPTQGGVGEDITASAVKHLCTLLAICIYKRCMASIYKRCVLSATGFFQNVFITRRLQLEQGMSYTATSFFEYMNTYADIIYAYGVSGAIRHDMIDGHCVLYSNLWLQLPIAF